MSRKVAASLETIHLPVVSRMWLYVNLLAACVISTTFAWVSQWQASKINREYEPSTLAEYGVVLRVVPSLIASLVAVLCSLVLGLFDKVSRWALHRRGTSGGNSNDLSAQLATGESMQRKALEVHCSKPDLQQEIERADLGQPLHVEVCGPKRMILSVETATQVLSKRKCKVTLEVHDSGL
jgi:hypothetical protein